MGFFAFQLTGTIVVGILISIVIMLWHHPRTFGLGVMVPYYCCCVFSMPTRTRRGLVVPPELDMGAPWRSFSTHFPPMRWMRQFLQLSLQAGSGGTSGSSNKNKNPGGPLFSSKDQNPQHQQQYIFAVFPHGINGDYRVLMDGMLDTVLSPDAVHRTRTLAASVLFKIPLLRELVLWTGCVDASVAVADNLLHQHFNLIVLPGGQQEQIRTQFGEEQVYVKRRKGFVRLALRHRVPVVPVYVFGSVDLYRTSSPSRLGWTMRQFWLKNLGVAIPPLYWGYWGSICCPNPVTTTVVFGKPLYLHDIGRGAVASRPCANDVYPSTAKETDSNNVVRNDTAAPAAAADNDTARVDAAHAVFVDALVKLFDENKARLGYGDRTLRVL